MKKKTFSAMMSLALVGGLILGGCSSGSDDSKASGEASGDKT